MELMMMKKVKFRDYGSKEDVFPKEGLFHQWAPDSVELDEGACNFTVALVQDPSGRIIQVDPGDIKFI